MALESWEMAIFQLAIGFLISGFILFIFSILIASMSVGDHDGDISTESEIQMGGHFDGGTDIDGQVDISTDFEVSGEVSAHLDTHGGIQSSVHDSVHIEGGGTPAPLLLLLSTFFLMFGAIGYTVYEAEAFNSMIRLVVTIIIPIGMVKLIGYIWKRYLSKEFAYEVPKVKIDNQVKTITRIDEKGGLVVADTADIDRPEKKLHFAGSIKMQARTLPGTIIEQGKIAYVVAIEKNTLIIDQWPSYNPKN